MEKTVRDSGRFLPLTEATYLTLISLAEAKHGYAIMQTVGAAGGGRLKLGPGTLYGALTKLLEQGLIQRAGESDAGGERRKLYVLTELGREVAALECERMESLARMGRRLLKTGERR